MKLATVVFALVVAVVAEVSSFSVPFQKSPKRVLALNDVKENRMDSLHVSDRRAFFWTSVAASLAVTIPIVQSPLPPVVSAAHAATTTDYKAVASDIADLFKKNPDWGPTIVRLSWHSSGTYDKISKTGGSSGGTIRFPEELAHSNNEGLDKPIKWLEPIYKKYQGTGLSHADLYTLAGVSAIKEMGGPTIPWSSGRVDEMNPSNGPPDGRLPNADTPPEGVDKNDAAHLRKVFNRMGFDDREIVCLSGAHSLGRAHLDDSGYDGPWTGAPTTFGNGYFVFILGSPWVPERTAKGKLQYKNPIGGQFMMLPTDLILRDDWRFRFWVWVYAKRPFLFRSDFAKAFQKLEELGTSHLAPTDWA